LAAAIDRVVAEFQPHVVHGHNWISNSYRTGRSRPPLVVTLHDYGQVCATHRLMRNGAVCAGPAVLRCLSCSSGHYGAAIGTATWAGVRVMTPRRRRQAAAFLPVSTAVSRSTHVDTLASTVVIPNFIPTDSEVAAVAPPGLPDRPFVVMAGDISRDKGADVLIDALAGSDIDVVFMGRPVDVDPPAGPTVHVIGPQPHDVAMHVVRRAELLVAPSRWPDPCPTVVLEAMAAGRAVVSTAHGGMTDQVDHGVTGLLVPPSDVAALRRAIVDLWADADRREGMGAAAVVRSRLFTVGAVVDRILEVYERAVTGLLD
jgi:glycosyltransferase involved in cell wall biosynthesis